MAVLIDTDVLVAYERAGRSVEDLLADQERLLSVITVSELLHGVHRASGGERIRRAAFVEHVIGTIDAVPISKMTARVHAQLGASLVASGLAIGTHDLWIAATAIVHDFAVATLNARDFSRVPGLRVLSPA